MRRLLVSAGLAAVLLGCGSSVSADEPPPTPSQRLAHYRIDSFCDQFGNRVYVSNDRTVSWAIAVVKGC